VGSFQPKGRANLVILHLSAFQRHPKLEESFATFTRQTGPPLVDGSLDLFLAAGISPFLFAVH
jgi:hypothetical protein